MGWERYDWRYGWIRAWASIVTVTMFASSNTCINHLRLRRGHTHTHRWQCTSCALRNFLRHVNVVTSITWAITVMFFGFSGKFRRRSIQLAMYAMEKDMAFHVSAMVLEAAILVRLAIQLVHSLKSGRLPFTSLKCLLPSSPPSLRKLWSHRPMDHQTSEELDLLRCRMTCRSWQVLFIIGH